MTSKLAFHRTPSAVRRGAPCTNSYAANAVLKRLAAATSARGSTPHGRGKRQHGGGSASQSPSGESEEEESDGVFTFDADSVRYDEDISRGCLTGEGYDWSGDPTDYILDQIMGFGVESRFSMPDSGRTMGRKKLPKKRPDAASGLRLRAASEARVRLGAPSHHLSGGKPSHTGVNNGPPPDEDEEGSDGGLIKSGKGSGGDEGQLHTSVADTSKDEVAAVGDRPPHPPRRTTPPRETDRRRLWPSDQGQVGLCTAWLWVFNLNGRVASKYWGSQVRAYYCQGLPSHSRWRLGKGYWGAFEDPM